MVDDKWLLGCLWKRSIDGYLWWLVMVVMVEWACTWSNNHCHYQWLMFWLMVMVIWTVLQILINQYVHIYKNDYNWLWCTTIIVINHISRTRNNNRNLLKVVFNGIRISWCWVDHGCDGSSIEQCFPSTRRKCDSSLFDEPNSSVCFARCICFCAIRIYS